MHESTTKLSSKAIKSTKSTNSMWIPGPSLSKGGAWGQWTHTVEPPNKVHFGLTELSLVERSSLRISQRSYYNTLSISMGLKQVSFLERLSLRISQRSYNTLSISMGLKQVSFVERLSLSRRVPYRRLHCSRLNQRISSALCR